MKSLDEIIKALSIPAVNGYHYIDSNDAIDALKYLEMYKELANDSALFAKWKENPPLTWNELSTMEGKPVWVEEYDPIDDNKGWRMARWNLIQWANSKDNVIYFVNDEWDQTVYHLSDYGKTWTAYRKERR